MRVIAYYNEIEPFAVQWLRNLIAAGHIMDGEVDDRSIVDVNPRDLERFTQCHFFAGIGVWSHALRRAGWPDERPIWTGSCPCQPFSVAGSGKGTADERHLWPVWAKLIGECRPPVIVGEQVASPAALEWFDAVSADLEGAGYAVGAADLCAASVGAPHIRQRLYWMANTTPGGQRIDGGTPWDAGHASLGDAVSGLEHSKGRREAATQQQGQLCSTITASSNSGMADSNGGKQGDGDVQRSGRLVQLTQDPLAGFWRGADWLACTDGKARPVEPGPQQMAYGFAESLGRLRPRIVEALTEEIEDADLSEGDIREAVRDLWIVNAQEAIQRATGRCYSLREAPVLLSFLRELARARWRFLDHLPPSCWESAQGGLRELRESSPEAARPSRGRESGEQRSEQSAHAMSVVSQALTHAIQGAWMIPHPLAHGATCRAGRLRAYGNAICAPLATDFMKAVMSCA